MDSQKTTQGVLFDDRFLDRYAGPIIADPAVAIVELVANAWDAYATRVDIVWPKRTQNIPFSITDNGKGMTPAQFDRRWKTLDYNGLAEEGNKSAPPPNLSGSPPRSPYGRNGSRPAWSPFVRLGRAIMSTIPGVSRRHPLCRPCWRF